MGWFDPNESLSDAQARQAEAEALLRQANALRATMPRGASANSYTPGPYPQYITPIADIASRISDPIQAILLDKMAKGRLEDAAAQRRAETEAAINSLPVNDQGEVDVSNKGKLFKWAIQASKVNSPIMEHILPKVIQSITSSDKPFISIAGGTARMNPNTGEVELVPEVTTAKATEEKAKEERNFQRQKDIIDYKAQKIPGKQVDPLTQTLRQLQIDKLNAEMADKAKGRPLTQGLEENVRNMAEDLSNAGRIYDNFKDEYAGSMMKYGERILGNTLGANADIIDKKAPELASWWQDYELFKNIPERFAKFGASLTTTEKAAWENATVNPKMDPKLIRSKLQTQLEILKNKMAGLRASQKASGANVGQIDAYLKQFGLIDGGRDITDPSGMGIREEDFRPGDRMGGKVYDGKYWVDPKEYSPPEDYIPEIKIGNRPSEMKTPSGKRFTIEKVE